MVDYSRFDKINVDSEDEEDETGQTTNDILTSASNLNVALTKKGKEGRLKFEYQGRTIYEWDQNLDEVHIYVQPPPGVKSSMIKCTISHEHLILGLKDKPPFLDEDTGGRLKSKESFWMIEDGEIHIQLAKMNKGEIWTCALKGKGAQMDAITTEDMKKKIMLERFQEENPGFDFSNAEFNGQVPDPQTFMGGIKYS